MNETLVTEKDIQEDQSIDTTEIDQQIDALGTALETVEEIFARRAAQLAKVPEAESESDRIPIALFWLGQEIYGVEAQHVIEIRPALQITRIPRVPNWVAGVVNLRGRILSVVKLHPYFGISAGEHLDQNEDEFTEEFPYLVVVQSQDIELALLVDAIITVDDFVGAHIKNIGDNVRGIPQEYILGVMEYENLGLLKDGIESMPVAILDIPTLLADEKLIIREEII